MDEDHRRGWHQVIVFVGIGTMVLFVIIGILMATGVWR